MASIKLELEMGKSELGYAASIGFMADGKGRASISLGEKNVSETVMVALAPILAIAPSLTQEELDKNYEAYSVLM